MISCPSDRRALIRSTRRRAVKRSAWIASSLLAAFVLAGCVVAPLPLACAARWYRRRY